MGLSNLGFIYTDTHNHTALLKRKAQSAGVVSLLWFCQEVKNKGQTIFHYYHLTTWLLRKNWWLQQTAFLISEISSCVDFFCHFVFVKIHLPDDELIMISWMSGEDESKTCLFSIEFRLFWRLQPHGPSQWSLTAAEILSSVSLGACPECYC